MAVRSLFLLAPLAILAGCAALPSKPVWLSGPWGGPGVSIVLEGGIGTVSFDCAGGTIDTNIPAQGPFSAAGTYRVGQGGPVRVGQIYTSQKATYAGTVDDKTMTLSVRLDDGNTVGPFTLAQGDPGQVTPCR